MNSIDPCKNCGGTEHFSKEVVAGGAAELLPIGSLHGPKYRILVCGSCGLTQWFVPQEFLVHVKEKFERVA
jgi:predicted nucleic-acid-binding Zn-ribbon protein